MCSGSVIHAVHSNEMTDMGGLLKKMPITAATMLVGCLAIAGAGLPFIIGLLGGPELAGLGLSGFYSKDAILEQAFLFMQTNRSAWAAVFFVTAAAGAAMTAFYMFRLWYLTFLGRPRNAHRHHHAHESPPVMFVPLVILAVMAIGVAWQPVQGVVGSVVALLAVLAWRLFGSRPAGEAPRDVRGLTLADGSLLLVGLVLLVAVSWWGSPLRNVTLGSLLREAEPVRAAAGMDGVLVGWKWPSEHESHQAAIVIPVTLIAVGASLAGFLLATLMYGLGRLNPDDVRRQFPGVYSFLRHKWWFDELYGVLFVKPALAVAGLAARIDRSWIDWAVDGLARCTRLFSLAWDRVVDQFLVDGLVNFAAAGTYRLGRSLRACRQAVSGST